MVNESDLPEFQRGLVPVGNIPQGTHTVTSKQASPLIKAIKLRMAKPKQQNRRPGKLRRGKTRGVEADSRVHFGNQKLGNRQFY